MLFTILAVMLLPRDSPKMSSFYVVAAHLQQQFQTYNELLFNTKADAWPLEV